MRGNGFMRSRARTRWGAPIVVGALMASLITSSAFAGHRVGASGGAALVAASTGNVLPSGTVRRPDGRIRLQKYQSDFNTIVYTKPWKGNNIYNTTGAQQTAKTIFYSTTPGTVRWTFGVSVQNDGSASDRFKLRATGVVLAGWTVRYFRGTTNITSAVVAGTYQTSSLAPAAKYKITVVVTRLESGFDGDFARLVTSRSVADPTRKDAVRLRLEAGACGC